jgi:outer membrane lipoprotein-sorting protein
MPMRRRLLPRRPEPRAAHGAARRAWLIAGTALVLAGAVAAAPGFDLGALTTLLGQVRSGEATFVETRRVEMLDRTLTASGRLSFRAPDKFVRETLKPRHEKLAVDGNTLTMSLGERSRTMQLDASPEAAVLVEAVRGTLTGNRAALERLFEATVSGTSERWMLELVPRDLRLRGQVQSVRLSGREATVREVEVLLADGDRSLMSIEPAAGTRTP